MCVTTRVSHEDLWLYISGISLCIIIHVHVYVYLYVGYQLDWEMVSCLLHLLSFQRVLCTGFNVGPEVVSLLERCPRFRGCYVQASNGVGT